MYTLGYEVASLLQYTALTGEGPVVLLTVLRDYQHEGHHRTWRLRVSKSNEQGSRITGNGKSRNVGAVSVIMTLSHTF